jgi:hypothetical protein
MINYRLHHQGGKYKQVWNEKEGKIKKNCVSNVGNFIWKISNPPLWLLIVFNSIWCMKYDKIAICLKSNCSK